MSDARQNSAGSPSSAGDLAVSGSEVTARGLISTERKVRVGFALALACLAVIAVVSYRSVVRLDENTA